MKEKKELSFFVTVHWKKLRLSICVNTEIIALNWLRVIVVVVIVDIVVITKLRDPRSNPPSRLSLSLPLCVHLPRECERRIRDRIPRRRNGSKRIFLWIHSIRISTQLSIPPSSLFFPTRGCNAMMAKKKKFSCCRLRQTLDFVIVDLKFENKHLSNNWYYFI